MIKDTNVSNKKKIMNKHNKFKTKKIFRIFKMKIKIKKRINSNYHHYLRIQKKMILLIKN